MIHKLSGIHETVDFREDEQVCLYYNDEYEITHRTGIPPSRYLCQS